MKIVETADGSVKVVELDPTKHHIIIMDIDSIFGVEDIMLCDGAIIVKQPGSHITFVETDDVGRIEKSVV